MKHHLKLVCGVGVNDAPYDVKKTIKWSVSICPFYRAWDNMIKRCYDEVSLRRNPTYSDCYVHQDWHSFMTFRSWMINQEWIGRQLDKDILFSGNKVYSAETCVFVSPQVNTIMTNCNNKKGSLPLGVSVNSYYADGAPKYQVSCRVKGKNKYLGVFRDVNAASNAYIEFKCAHILNFANEVEMNGSEDPKIIFALRRIAGEILDGYHDRVCEK